MKKILLIAAFIVATTTVSAQAYEGKGDQKVQIGANFQDGGTGIQGTYDYGLGENFSIGLGVAYALDVEGAGNPDLDERAMLALRFNAPIGNVINLDPNFDVYPGLAFTTKNFGGHLGARYFFTDGFGLFTEAAFPLAKYRTEDLRPEEELFNQFNVTLGAAFNF